MVSIDKQFFIDGLDEYALTDEFKDLYEQVFHGPFKISKIAKSVALVFEAVKVVEQLASDAGSIAAGSGKDKKDAVVGWLDDCIKLPFYLEPLDGVVIGIAIDAIVTFLNIKLTNNWLPKIREFL